MTIRIVYCVQVFRRQGRALESARVTSFGCEEDAMAAGAVAAKRAPMVRLFVIEVDADADLCGEPVVLRTWRADSLFGRCGEAA